MKLFRIGKIHSPHALKGEVKIRSSFNKFETKMNIYIDDRAYKLLNHRLHKDFHLLVLEDINNIDAALALKGKEVFINRVELELKQDEYLDEDLIGLNLVVDKKIIGRVNKIIDTSKNTKILSVLGDENYLLPYHKDLIKKVDLKEKTIEYNDLGGLIWE